MANLVFSNHNKITLQYHYNTLKGKYFLSNSRTRNKILPLPKLKKTVGFKNSRIRAIKMLPNEFKNLTLSKRAMKKKFQEWIIKN